jgi:hypothetical protein
MGTAWLPDHDLVDGQQPENKLAGVVHVGLPWRDIELWSLHTWKLVLTKGNPWRLLVLLLGNGSLLQVMQ